MGEHRPVGARVLVSLGLGRCRWVRSFPAPKNGSLIGQRAPAGRVEQHEVVQQHPVSMFAVVPSANTRFGTMSVMRQFAARRRLGRGNVVELSRLARAGRRRDRERPVACRARAGRDGWACPPRGSENDEMVVFELARAGAAAAAPGPQCTRAQWRRRTGSWISLSTMPPSLARRRRCHLARLRFRNPVCAAGYLGRRRPARRTGRCRR